MTEAQVVAVLGEPTYRVSLCKADDPAGPVWIWDCPEPEGQSSVSVLFDDRGVLLVASYMFEWADGTFMQTPPTTWQRVRFRLGIEGQ